MSAVNEKTYAKLVELARNDFNVLLTGTHGVGKTTLCQRIQKDIGITHVKYYSAATLDPWVDVVGIPVPDGDTIKFCRPQDLKDAEWVIFDEINRSHSKVQNALLEMIQFKTINGVPLPNLRMVWAMQNPPSAIYQVTELDPAMVDRFHARVTLTAAPSVDYYMQACMIPRDTAVALVDWWNRDLGPEDKASITPRTLESVGRLISRGIDWQFAIGDALGTTTVALKNRINGCSGLTKYERIDFPTMTLDLPKYELLAATDADFAVHVTRQALKSWAASNYKCASVLLKLPSEFMTKLLTDTGWIYKMKTQFKPGDGVTSAAQQLYDRVMKIAAR